MRTKALLLAAAFTAAGIATSTAQVYSVNAVGYVKVTLKPGFNLVSNPLTAANNSIAELFKNIEGGVPGGLSIFKFSGGNFLPTVLYDDLDNKFIPEDTALETVTPGNGVFVFNPGTTDLTLTFVGEVPQGDLSNALPQGFSIKGSQVPQAAKPDAIGMPGTPGDRLFRYIPATRSYQDWLFDDLDNKWIPDPGLPVINVGEAFFLFRANTAGTWNRTFSVNTAG
jgi:hypothetical protein